MPHGDMDELRIITAYSKHKAQLVFTWKKQEVLCIPQDYHKTNPMFMAGASPVPDRFVHMPYVWYLFSIVASHFGRGCQQGGGAYPL